MARHCTHPRRRRSPLRHSHDRFHPLPRRNMVERLRNSGRSHSPVLPRRIQQHSLPRIDNPPGLVADYSQQLVVAVHTTRHERRISPDSIRTGLYRLRMAQDERRTPYTSGTKRRHPSVLNLHTIIEQRKGADPIAVRSLSLFNVSRLLRTAYPPLYLDFFLLFESRASPEARQSAAKAAARHLQRQATPCCAACDGVAYGAARQRRQ